VAAADRRKKKQDQRGLKNQTGPGHSGRIQNEKFFSMGLLSMLGFGNSKIKEALRRGAIVIDVRTPQEFDQGKVPGSINIPVDRIASSAERIKNMNRPVVFCCASGARSGNAVKLMKDKGFKECYNGGNWYSVIRILKSI
jgi:phage shock protein E